MGDRAASDPRISIYAGHYERLIVMTITDSPSLEAGLAYAWRRPQRQVRRLAREGDCRRFRYRDRGRNDRDQSMVATVAFLMASRTASAPAFKRGKQQHPASMASTNKAICQ